MIEDWSKERRQLEDQQAPISPDMLLRLDGFWNKVCKDEVVLFRGATFTAFFAALRVSELVVRCFADGQGQSGHRLTQFIFWAAWFAAHSRWGLQLGLGAHANLEWRGWRVMLWNGFMELASQDSPAMETDILLVHLGSNNLTQMPGILLVLKILVGLRFLKDRCSRLTLVWLAIIPRMVWRKDCNPVQVDKARRKVNREVATAMREGLGAVIEHPNIVVSFPELLRARWCSQA
ncbi:hypothetical protein JRQ81_019392 [Phrynocephalus forsythii]|uniref:Uncharacterized protein n=1 Tax=Phrynocephalus forsythii TaxID=171643 RepID=A0A9Q1AYG7_9SAUR|nr:hypothetical protein JRQ81_019392 [Phrynocephalus forsythii]